MIKLKRPPLMLVVVLAMLALLPLLAVLQYRWLGAVSRGERERMKSNLEAGAAQFTGDFDREIRNLYNSFKSGAWTAPERSQAELIEEYIRWKKSSIHPELVDQIYQTFDLGQGETGLLRFDRSEMRLIETAWPDKLERLRMRMLQTRQTGTSTESIIKEILKSQLPGQIPRETKGTIIQFTAGPIDEEIPALIVHIIPVPESGGAFPGTPSYRIITLNLDYIQKEFLPELTKRYFNSGENGDFLVSVVQKKPSANSTRRIIYASDAGLPVDKGDVSRPLLRITLNEPEKYLVTGVSKNTKPGSAVAISRETKRVAISVMQSDVSVLNSSLQRGTGYVARSVVDNTSDGRWELIIKHRSGSLEAAVTSVRRRNMVISFGILVLLGISTGFILLNTRRAQKLAMQQMEFVAGVSHELRTPLAVICSAAENLADGVVDNPEQTRRYGGLIRNEGRRLTEMVEQVLEFAGAQSGRKTYDLRPVSISEVLEDALNACRQSLLHEGFEVECEIDDELPLVPADLHALSRVIQNLVNNAMKYSGDSRWIGITARKNGIPGREELTISVSDHGIGIPSSELTNIFEPFYRGKEVVSAQIHGNGLGLSLVRHIVESHGGSVTVSNRLQEGTTFTVHLPLADPQTAGIPNAFSDQTRRNYEQKDFAG